MRKRATIILTVILAAFCATTVAHAQLIAQKISFQGVLRNADGTVVADGDHDVLLAIYLVESGPMTPMWNEVQTVTTVDGLFNTYIGEVTPLPDSIFQVSGWLEVSPRIDGEFLPLSPRIQLTPSPAAFYALNVAIDAVTTEGLAPSAVLEVNIGYGAVTTNKLADGAVTAAKMDSTAYVGSLNGLPGHLTLVGGDNVTVTPSGNDLVIDAATGAGGGDDGDWTVNVDDNMYYDHDNTVTIGSFVPIPMATGQAHLQITGDTTPALSIDNLGTKRWSLVNQLAQQDLHIGYTNNAFEVPAGILIVDDDGEVGIGRTPGATLDILGGNYDLSDIESDLRIGDGGDVLQISVDTVDPGAGRAKFVAKAADGSPLMNFEAGTTTLSLINDYIRIYTDGTQRARFWGGDSNDQGGLLEMYGLSSTVSTVELDGHDGSGGYVGVKSDGGTLAASMGVTSSGGLIRVRDTAGNVTVEIDGEYADGNGRVTTEVLEITGGSDLSEQFTVASMLDRALEPGTVVCIDPDNPGGLQVSASAYDRKVAGIISGAGGVRPGMLMGQRGSVADGEHPVALTGRVYVKADASAGPIAAGDLLTTSDKPGHAMRVTDHGRANGAILGKAMTALDEGTGLVLVLVSLQ